MSGGGDGLRSAEPGAHFTEVVAERGMAVEKTLSSQAESFGSPVFDQASVSRKDAAAADAIVRAKAEPGSKVFRGRESGKVITDFREEDRDGGGVDPRDRGKINSSNAIEMSTDIETGFISLGFTPGGGSGG